MNFSKWSNIIKIILLKILEEIERRINQKNGVESSDTFSTSLYTSLKFIVLEQVDGLVDEVVKYTKLQVNDLADLIARKTSAILASMVYILILLGLVALAFVFVAITLSLYLGDILGHTYYGFLITACFVILLSMIIYIWGQKAIAIYIKNQLLKNL
jgi:hypothetical protein